VRLLTRWQQWWVAGREEFKFHCDLLLAPGEWVQIYDSAGRCQGIGNETMFTKVHLTASWEHRPTEFVEGE